MVPFHLRLGTEKKTPYPESLYSSDIEPERGIRKVDKRNGA